MKTSSQVIRVSAVRARDSVPSLSGWLDTVQVRPLNAAAGVAPAADDEAPCAGDGGAAAAELSNFVTFRIL
jgi:hypothetical protein